MQAAFSSDKANARGAGTTKTQNPAFWRAASFSKETPAQEAGTTGLLPAPRPAEPGDRWF